MGIDAEKTLGHTNELMKEVVSELKEEFIKRSSHPREILRKVEIKVTFLFQLK